MSKSWGFEALQLWKLLDDIDTLDDACKGNDEVFRDHVQKIQKKRWNILGEDQVDALSKRYR
jgi:hypothetical protein